MIYQSQVSLILYKDKTITQNNQYLITMACFEEGSCNVYMICGTCAINFQRSHCNLSPQWVDWCQLRKLSVKCSWQQAARKTTFLISTCTHSLPCRSAAEPDSWACPCLHRSRTARWFASGALRRPCRCRDRTAARGCSQGEHGQKTSSVPCCTLVGYMAPSGLMAGCRPRRILYEASDTSHLCYTPWQHPGSGSPSLLQTLEDTNGGQKAFHPSVWFEKIKSQAMFTNDFKA